MVFSRQGDRSTYQRLRIYFELDGGPCLSPVHELGQMQHFTNFIPILIPLKVALAFGNLADFYFYFQVQFAVDESIPIINLVFFDLFSFRTLLMFD